MKAVSVTPGRPGPELIAGRPEPPPQAAGALERADPAWLGGLVTRRVPLSSWRQVLTRRAGDVKVVVDLTK